MVRKISVLVAIAVLLSFMLGCGPSPEAYRFDGMGDWGYPTPFAAVPRGPSYIRASLIFDTLLWKDDRGLIPWLATSYERVGDAYRFHLRKDVKWSDGMPFTADDVVFSYRYLKEHPPRGFVWGALYMVKDVKKVDDYTVDIIPVKDSPEFLELTAATVLILPRHIWQSVSDPYAYTATPAFVGTGPFTLKLYDRAGRYVFAPKGDWWGGRVIDRYVEFIKSSSPTDDILAGRLDAIYLWGPKAVVAKDVLGGRLVLTRSDTYFLYYVIFNIDRLNLTQRRAISALIDRDRLVNSLLKGSAEVSRLVKVDMDRDEALRVLRGVGTLVAVSSTKFEDTSLAVVNMLKEAGLDVKLKVLPMDRADDEIKKGNFDIAITAHGGMSYGTAWVNITWPYDGWHSERWQEVAQRLMWNYPEGLMDEISRVLSAEVPIYDLYRPYGYMFVRKGFDLPVVQTVRGVGAGIHIPINKLMFVEGGGS